MSQENVEIVRRSYEGYVRGDLEAALKAFDPEIEAYDHDIPDAGDYRGLSGLLRSALLWLTTEDLPKTLAAPAERGAGR